MRKKVSYNPFKMLGSWIGAIIIFTFSIIDIFTTLISKSGVMIRINLLSHIFGIFVGFLIGWGIHSLIKYSNARRKRKKKK